MGLGAAADVLGGDQRIESALVDANGIVRVEASATSSPRILLETHFIALQWRSVGLGPAMGIVPIGTEGSLFSAGFLGGAVGFKAGDRSWNVIVGYLLDFNATFLGEEFIPGLPAPVGPDGDPLPLRFFEKSAGSLLIGTTFDW